MPHITHIMFTLHGYTFKVVYFNIYPFILVLNPEHEGHNSGDRERFSKKKNEFSFVPLRLAAVATVTIQCVTIHICLCAISK